MKCPFCGKENTRVIDSRPADDGSSIRRRRQCDECSKRFTTYEKVEAIPLVVIKKDNNSLQINNYYAFCSLLSKELEDRIFNKLENELE